jgi:hypothetical protein
LPLAKFTDVRELLEKVKDFEMRIFLKSVYLFAVDPSELTAKLNATDKPRRTFVYGPKGTDAAQDMVELHPDFDLSQVLAFSEYLRSKEFRPSQAVNELSKVPIAIFNLPISRNEPKDETQIPHHLLALPLSSKYEPWAKEVFDYFKAKSDNHVFPFNRQFVWEYIRRKDDIFEGYTYEIGQYHSSSDYTKTIDEHPRKLGMTALRYLRRDELFQKYCFDWVDFEAYTGRILKTQIMRERLSGPDKRESWKRYINKLCTQK